MTITTEATTTAAIADSYRKEIVFDRETRDFAMYLDGELVGFASSLYDAERSLDALVYELAKGDKYK